MRSGVGVASRPAWYDRNGIAKSFVGNAAALAPHGTTTRASYTAPTGKRAVVTNATSTVYRVTVATAAGRCNQYAGRFVSPNNVTYAQAFLIAENAIGSRDRVAVSPQDYLNPGDQILLQDDDVSTGGTVTFESAISLVEFDA